jgi:ABC-2 type transport system ATP-binding protein
MDEVYAEDHLIVLHKGQIKGNGTVQEVLSATQSTNIAEAFSSLTQA